jgi:hypothetical protein
MKDIAEYMEIKTQYLMNFCSIFILPPPKKIYLGSANKIAKNNTPRA